MKKFRWQLLIIFLAGLIVGTLLILEKRGGLGGVTGSPQPIEGGVYTEAVVGQLVRLNPLLDANNQADRDIDHLIFSGLIKFDSDGIPEPDLAETLGISEDGLLYNIKLREGLTWHDGEPLTTADVLFTIDLMKNGEGFIAEDLINLWKSVEVIKLDDLSLQFKLTEAYAPFQDYLAFGLLPEHLLSGQTLAQIADSQFNLQPVGSGPFKFESLTVENSQITGIKLSANKDYLPHAPYIQEINFRYYADAESALQALKDGYVQGISQIPNHLIAEALSLPDLSVYTGRVPQIGLILINLKDPESTFLQEKEIRQALLLGINRQKIITDYFNGQGIVADSVILPDTWAYLDSVQTYAYDPEQAALLLKTAGFVVTGDENPVRKKDDVALKLVLSYPDDDLHKHIAESIQADWQALSIDVALEAVPPDSFLSTKLEPRAYQVALVDLDLSATPDPDPYPFWDLGQAAAGQNYTQWDSQIASDTIEQARITVDFDERIRLYHNFQSIFASELPALPLYYPVYNYGVTNQILGISVGPLIDTSSRFATITEWYMSARTVQGAAETSGN
jgi:peptide/nickel transport system substrate-binding protein